MLTSARPFSGYRLWKLASIGECMKETHLAFTWPFLSRKGTHANPRPKAGAEGATVVGSSSVT